MDDVNNCCHECGVSANVLTCLKKFKQPPYKLHHDISTFYCGVCDCCKVDKAVTEVRDYFYPDFSLLIKKMKKKNG